jgi:hypothetical protein
MLIAFHNVIYNSDFIKNITLTKETITFRLTDMQDCLAIYDTEEEAKKDFRILVASLARTDLLRCV